MPTHPLTRQGKQAMRAVIDQATKTPHAYLWWHSLPAKGRHSKTTLLQKWTALVLTTLFPQELLTAMLRAALSPNGTPSSHSKPLYNWLVVNIYKSNSILLYKDWLQLPKQS